MAKPGTTNSPARIDSPPPPARMIVPELLAPAGDWECARAAVENGADAIYFGLEKFNARMRAHNFTEADLPQLMEFLHRRGVRGYVTFNTLIFENELADAETYLRAIIAAGVDAAIVQDAGICRLIRQLSPDFPIHASTQMTITSAAGVEFARDLGCSLVVLARECSLKEIEKIQRSFEPGSADASANSKPETQNQKLPLEVFVHGALCVAYSGQCLTSEALGGRSANRGECAQACRMPYELLSDGASVPLGDRKYLLSPQDLAGLEVLPDLIRTGVASLKIEGRLKSPEYVANITRLYRKALDQCRSDALGSERPESAISNSRSPNSDLQSPISDPRSPAYEMEMAFSRGLYTGWFGGINNQQLVHARFGKKRGVLLGEVKRILRDGVVVDLKAPLKPGDGVVFDAGKPEEKEQGGRVYQVEVTAAKLQSPATIHFGTGDIDFSRVHAGDRLWKTSDPELDRELRQTFETVHPRFRRPIDIEVHGQADAPLTIIVRDELGHVARVDSKMPLTRAAKQPLTPEKLREQLGRLGGTPFLLRTLNNLLGDGLLLPVSELNRMRRDAVAELERLRTLPKRWNVHDCSSPDAHGRSEASHSRAEPQLIVLIRKLDQLEAVLESGVATVYCDFENPKKYRDAVTRFRAQPLAGGPPASIFVAPPRIFKMGEEWTLEQVRSCDADGYLVRNYDHLKIFERHRRIGDFSLNIANHLSADYFHNCFGLERVTASYDLNVAQLTALLRGAPSEWFEITIHQHMPMFHMEHCVFCAFLSSGTDYTNCGRPCDHHDVKLRDRVGSEHPVKADVGCRNTVFNAVAQTGAEYVGELMALGARHFRIEFLNETPDQVAQTIGKYQRLLRGEIAGRDVWRELKLINQLGVTRGQMPGQRG
jgi:putative protease